MLPAYRTLNVTIQVPTANSRPFSRLERVIFGVFVSGAILRS